MMHQRMHQMMVVYTSQHLASLALVMPELCGKSHLP